MTLPTLQWRQLVLAGATGLLCTSATLAVTPGAVTEAQARFRQDMAVCEGGQSNQDPDTCRREARNALAAAEHGELGNGPGASQRNALQRCAALEGTDRSDCESRVDGEGSVEGSVASGGILRETVTIIPVK